MLAPWEKQAISLAASEKHVEIRIGTMSPFEKTRQIQAGTNTIWHELNQSSCKTGGANLDNLNKLES